jgi:hypothetical protein
MVVALTARKGLVALIVITGFSSCRSSPIDAAADAAGAASENVDAAPDMATEPDPQKACQSSAECVLVNWGCCDDACWGGLRFTTAVNRASEGKVVRVGQCGQVCSLPMPCGFVVSATCDDGACAVHCAGDCPVNPGAGDQTDAMAVEAGVTSPSDSR